LFRHTVPVRISTAALREATKDQLVAAINQEANKITTMNATIDISASVGGPRKGKATDYPEMKGYLLVKRPEDLRLVGLVPIVRTTAFDMVSNGTQFKLSIPAKSKFIVGSNNVVRQSTNPLENLRPQIIWDSLLLEPIDPKKEIVVLEGGFEQVIDVKTHKPVTQPNYVLDVIRQGEEGPYLSRKIYFSRTDLLPHQQTTFERSGTIATESHYDKFQNFDSLQFPSKIEIVRPREEYTINISIDKLKVNVPLTADQFALTQPSGSQLVNVDELPSTGLRAQDGRGANPRHKQQEQQPQ
jgi:outer membrane lipoprotein-sorting protein